MNVRLVHALVATLLATGPKCAEAGLCGRFEDGGETCSWSGCNARGTWCDTIGLNECRYTKYQTWCDTIGLNECRYTKCKDGNQCTENIHCDSGSCKLGNCCNGAEGRSTGCIGCDADGDCNACSEDYVNSNGECVLPGSLPDGHACESVECECKDSWDYRGEIYSGCQHLPLLGPTKIAPSTEVTGGTEPASTAESDDAGEEISDENSEATETGSGVNDDDAASPSKTPSAVSENEDADLLPKIESAGSESDDANAGESEDSADESNDTIDANASVLCSEGVCEKEKNAGKIVGIVIGVLIAVVVVAFFAFRRDKDHVSSSNPAATTKEVISFENPTYELGESSDEHVVQLIDSWDDFDGNGYLDVAGAEGDMPLYDAASATAGGSDGDDMQLYDAASATAGGSDGDGMPLYDAATATAVGSGDSFGNDGEFDDPAEHDDGGLANESDSSDISL
eukprot:gene9657-31165_t